jgi:hypothetical protein
MSHVASVYCNGNTEPETIGLFIAFDMVNIFTSTDGVILIPFWLNLGFVAERKERSGHRATRGVL